MAGDAPVIESQKGERICCHVSWSAESQTAEAAQERTPIARFGTLGRVTKPLLSNSF